MVGGAAPTYGNTTGSGVGDWAVYNLSMRLRSDQVDAIAAAAAEVFGDDAQVWLFGSRVDDSRHGGDIDLYVETGPLSVQDQVRLKSRLWVKLQRLLGERKIDIVTHARGTPMRPIDQQARATGVRL